MVSTHKERKAALGELLSIGRQMSNLCFNVAQMKGFRKDIPVTADECRRAWDAALSKWQALNKTPAKGKQ